MAERRDLLQGLAMAWSFVGVVLTLLATTLGVVIGVAGGTLIVRLVPFIVLLPPATFSLAAGITLAARKGLGGRHHRLLAPRPVDLVIQGMIAVLTLSLCIVRTR